MAVKCGHLSIVGIRSIICKLLAFDCRCLLSIACVCSTEVRHGVLSKYGTEVWNVY